MRRARAVRSGPLGAATALGLLCALAGCAGPPPRHVPAPDALGPYSAAVRAGGQVHFSGKIAPLDACGADFAAEAEGALAALLAELARASLGAADLVSVTVYLTDMADYAAFNAVYERLVPAPRPARACVAVAALPRGARVEIAAVAAAR